MNSHLEYQKKKELILGFNRSAVAALVNSVDTLSIQDPAAVLMKLTPDVVCMTRQKMEDDLSIVHPIMYMMVVNSTGTHFVMYKRGANGTEEKLRDHSCGFGGHVDIIDFVFTDKGVLDPLATVRASALRELEEELPLMYPVDGNYDNHVAKKASPLGRLKEVGLIYEPTDVVGSTHLAIVCVYQLADYVTFRSGEDDIEAPVWAEFGHPDLANIKFENWSKIMLEHYDVILSLAGVDGDPVSYQEMAADVESYKAMQKETAVAV